MKMLDLDRCLPDLCEALDDHSYEHHWWFDPETGEFEFRSDYADELHSGDELEERGFLYIHPTDSGEGYRDMVDFIYRVADPRAREQLDRAITGRGAFRRFKDVLLDYPELRETWFRFHDARTERRAIDWLQEQELITPQQADTARAARPEPELPPPPLDAVAVARAVAADLRQLYDERLKDVVLFGSQARGDAQPDSDIDLMVVLDEVQSRRTELLRASDVLWRHSLANDTVVTQVPVSEADYRESRRPLLVSVRAEGVSVA
jgi:predicted nucleotidyltransferase